MHDNDLPNSCSEDMLEDLAEKIAAAFYFEDSFDIEEEVKKGERARKRKIKN